ncbi:hypothetical protein CEK25_010291 [Fusarium fujikuroi]|nr:hypothetical protein CEK25_010291 [Fusarium fujikuroi]
MESVNKPSFEMGNNATVKAAGDVNVSAKAEPDSGRSSTSNYHDKDQLERMGKKQVLRRNFGFMTILGFSCTILITWEAITVLFAQGLNNGGTAGVIYSFLVVWVGNFSVFATMVAMMAPRSCSKFLSHLTGMLTVGGWQGSVSSSALLTGNMILGMATLNYPDFQPELWQGTLLFWAIFGFAVFINTLVSSVLPKFEGLILILHILGFFAILIPLMSEETVNPSVVVPTSILLSLCINGACGFAMVIAMVFCMGNLDDAMASGPGMLGFPYMYIFKQATNSRAGATVMSAIIVLLAACATVGMLASTSRVFWSFARDRGLPGWRTLSKVSDRTTVPVYSVLCTAVISILLSLINIGSPVAFQNVTSLSISCLYSSYLIAAGLLLYRRLTKGFTLPGSSDLPALANTTGAELVWGPFHLKGAFGIANNIFAMCYLIVVGFFSFWPPMVEPTVDMMNYSVVVTGGLVIFSVIYYFAWARKEYNGPIVE